MLNFIKSLFTRHIHDWQLTSVSYTSPAPTIGQDALKLLPKHARHQAIHGSTSQNYYCATCRKFKTITTAGLPEDHLESMLDWVDSYGHKYIDRQTKTYVIIKTRDEDIEPTQPNKLPLRPPAQGHTSQNTPPPPTPTNNTPVPNPS